MAIALAFGVQAILIAGVLAASAGSTASAPSSSAASSSAGPAAVTIVPLASPPDVGVTNLWTFPVIVRIGEAIIVASYPDPGPGSRFVVKPGSDVIAQVTVPASYANWGLSFGLGITSPRTGQVGSIRSLLNVHSPQYQGTLAFTLHLGAVVPGSSLMIYLTVTYQNPSPPTDVVIAEITTS